MYLCPKPYKQNPVYLYKHQLSNKKCCTFDFRYVSMCSSAGDTATNQGNRDMNNFKSCNAHITEELERQVRLIESAMKAVEEGELERARLFSNSAQRCANEVSSFLGAMIEDSAA